ncbi:MAG: phosphodiester glycosidase family protein [Verrucomicrobiota bacterium]
MQFSSNLCLPSLLTACVISCTPIPKAPVSTHQSSPPTITQTVSESQPLIIPPVLTDPSVSSPKVVSKTLSNIQFQGVSFDSRSNTLKPIDQTNGPGSQYISARDCATKQQALLAINAGFFTPEGNPLGLVISQGKRSGSWNSSSSLGTGIYRIDPSGNASISRRTQASAVSNSKELLQAGPLLIENHNPIAGLDQSKVAMRSILLHDGGHRWWIGIASPCSLADLSRALSTQSPAGWKISHALNLDGGRSTDLFVSSKISGAPLERKSLMNRQVRNFLILK